MKQYAVIQPERVQTLNVLERRRENECSLLGKVRYMTASGLECKCDIQAYIQKVQQRSLKGA
jgi:hypothetical protein